MVLKKLGFLRKRLPKNIGLFGGQPLSKEIVINGKKYHFWGYDTKSKSSANHAADQLRRTGKDVIVTASKGPDPGWMIYTRTRPGRKIGSFGSRGDTWFVLEIQRPSQFRLKIRDDISTEIRQMAYRYPKEVRLRMGGIFQELNMVVEANITKHRGAKLITARKLPLVKKAVVIANKKLKQILPNEEITLRTYTMKKGFSLDWEK